MNVLYKGNIAEIWEIGRDTYKPDWVQEAIKLNYIVWLDNHVRIFFDEYIFKKNITENTLPKINAENVNVFAFNDYIVVLEKKR